MNKKYLVLLFIIIILIILIISTIWYFIIDKKVVYNQEMESHKMIIKKIENRDEILGTSLIRTLDANLEENTSSGIVSTDEMMLNIGRVFNCLGEPNYISINSENWFEYDLRCDGIILTVYGNSLEIHIGGMPDEQSKIKADELLEYIKSFEPKDIYYETYYMDFESKEIFEIKNGKPFYRYEQLHLTEKEFVELYRKVYNLNDES